MKGNPQPRHVINHYLSHTCSHCQTCDRTVAEGQNSSMPHCNDDFVLLVAAMIGLVTCVAHALYGIPAVTSHRSS